MSAFPDDPEVNEDVVETARERQLEAVKRHGPRRRLEMKPPREIASKRPQQVLDGARRRIRFAEARLRANAERLRPCIGVSPSIVRPSNAYGPGVVDVGKRHGG